ncbi:PAS domain S-box protein, partial [delta proteobacterium NaphS2]
DNNHRLTYVNKAFENLTGISATKILGTSDHWRAFYPSKRPTMADLIVDNADEKEIAAYYDGKCQKSVVSEWGFESERLFTNSGKEGKWLFFTASPLKDTDGNISGAIETLQDITEQKKAEEALRESRRGMRSLLDFVPYPIVVSNLDGSVSYVTPAFTETFGWTLEELVGKTIPYTPKGLEAETGRILKELLEKKLILRHVTKRLTKDGRLLDVVIRGAIYSKEADEPGGELVLLRDITRERRTARNNQAMLRISMALPEYPDLENLLDYISREIKELLETEGALVLLIDEDRGELFYKGAAYDDSTTQKRIKEIRFPMDKSVAGKVIRTGKPIVVADTAKEPSFYPGVDEILGYHTQNLLEVPLRSGDRIIGALCARNKKEGTFEESDIELLNMIAGTVVLSIENVRFSEEILNAYKTNDALLRISTALPEHPDLGDLLDFVSDEVKRLMDSEGALVTLLDEENKELFFIGAAYDDIATQRRIKEIRFPIDKLFAGQVIKTGKPMIINDTRENPAIHLERDKILGYQTRNLLLVPLRSRDRIIGVLCAINKKKGGFDQGNMEFLNLVAGTVELSIENARFSEEVKKAYREVSSLNRAKDKVINHLSHELKTPVSVLSGSLNIIARKLASLPDETWKNTLARGERNLERIIEIQNQVEDIMRERHFESHSVLRQMVDLCADELETLVAEQVGEGNIVQTIRKRIDDIFSPKEMASRLLILDQIVRERLEGLKPRFSHRKIRIIEDLSPTEAIKIPMEALRKVIDGLVKNAVENTPDEGKIEIRVNQTNGLVEMTVKDYGVGIIDDAQRRIFEGFFATQDTLDYSSKRAFDFNAGGKGADLLRMKIFAERYGFKIRMTSDRCPVIPQETDMCPGIISECSHCKRPEDCFASGGTTFTLHFRIKKREKIKK